MSYYTINEEAARTANDLNSHYTYREGSATASYRRQVDEATELAERQKKRVDPMYHEKIDRLLDLYCRKLAENLNDKYAIAARCPSMLVSGRANFPVQKKKKQNAAEERRLEEWKHIQGLLDKIRSVGTGGKILHTGDIHLGDLAGPTKDGANLRRQDTLRCMDAIVNKARTEGPTVTIIAGDLFNRSRVWADTALDDVNDAISRFIVPLCEYSDAVVLLFGTMNHDNPRAFEVIRKATPDLKNLHIYIRLHGAC